MTILTPFLGSMDLLTSTSQLDDKGADYVHPALKNLGCVSLVVLREAIAPVVFRNAEPEITDIEIAEQVHVRAVPNKFKFVERGRGLQILRAYGVGGRLPQNKTMLFKGQKPSAAFDLNTLVFGDSAVHETRVLPVKAAVTYSDALSLKPKHACVDQTFHNRASEDGTLFDATDKKNSDNLFNRHFILPGTLMVQVLSTRGKLLPELGLQHLMLSMGLAGAYGGQTSTTGTNIRTHVVGFYGGRFERALGSPYELVKALRGQQDLDLGDVGAVSAALNGLLKEAHEVSIPTQEAQSLVDSLITRFESDDEGLKADYVSGAPKVAALFDQWFGKDK
jgi:CRISPR-associated protein Csc2